MFEEYKSRTGTYPHVEFETNGTMIPSDRLDQFIQEHGHYNVSTKLENSNATEATGYTPDEEEYNWNTRERRIKPLAMKFFTENKKAYFKFVIDSKLHALKEVKGLQTEFNIPNNKVWIMPEGMSPEDINAGALPLIEVCKAEGYRFSTRLHILVWGYLRGV